MTRAIILAAGQGTRLRPLTNDRPKCLVPLKGRSLLERQVDILRKNGISDIHIATGYRSDQIEALGFEITFNPKFKTTNMVESLFGAMSFLEKDGDLIIAYGDIVYESANLQKLLACDEAIGIMVDSNWREFWSLRLENPLDDAETFITDENDYVVELGKKPENYESIQGQYTGLIKVRADKVPALIDFYISLDRADIYDGKTFDNMYMTSFIQKLIDIGWLIKSVRVENGWLEIDSVEDLKLYEDLSDRGQLSKFYGFDT